MAIDNAEIVCFTTINDYSEHFFCFWIFKGTAVGWGHITMAYESGGVNAYFTLTRTHR